jgi:Uma2 family endonuclease
MFTEQWISAETFAEFSQQPQYAGKLLELVHGEIVEMSKPGGKHGFVLMRIARWIANWVFDQDLGYVTAAETGYITRRSADGRDTVRGLDLGFIRKARLPDGLPDGFIPFTPDLAVEVISPGNAAQDIHDKVLELLNGGTRLIWLVYLNSQTVMVYTPDSVTILRQGDTLDGGDVLPGFTLSVADIFHGLSV